MEIKEGMLDNALTSEINISGSLQNAKVNIAEVNIDHSQISSLTTSSGVPAAAHTVIDVAALQFCNYFVLLLKNFWRKA